MRGAAASGVRFFSRTSSGNAQLRRSSAVTNATDLTHNLTLENNACVPFALCVCVCVHAPDTRARGLYGGPEILCGDVFIEPYRVTDEELVHASTLETNTYTCITVQKEGKRVYVSQLGQALACIDVKVCVLYVNGF